MYIVKISVRNLVESILYSGDIGSELLLLSPERAEIGSKVHRLHQKNMMEEKSEYIKEYYLKTEYESDDIKILLDGRADGLVPWEYIEEIKSTYRPLEELEENDYPLHWAQLKFYGYMAMQLNEIEKITLRLTYFNIDSEDFRSFDSVFTKAELTAFAKDVLDKFVKLKSLYFKWIEKRNISIKGLKFPFYEYRPGQRKMSTSIYGTIKENKRMFIQAPTGIGKTISALFPSIKALGEKKIDRIFYLTPKGTGKAIGEESIMLLRQEGGKLRSITLTSKEKICFMDEVKCNAE
ncbi:MAG: PD-(D/E)XK nuclease family protein, partial [Clostridiaceae bacterium]